MGDTTKAWLQPISRPGAPGDTIQEECGDFKRGACFRATCKFLHGGKPASEHVSTGIPGSVNAGSAGLPTPKAAGKFEAPAGLDQECYDMNTGFGLFGTDYFGTRFGSTQPLAKIENVRPLCMDFYKQGFCNRRGPHNQGCLFRHDEIEGKGKVEVPGKADVSWEVCVFGREAQGKKRNTSRCVVVDDLASAAAAWVEKRKAEVEAEEKIAADTKAAAAAVAKAKAAAPEGAADATGGDAPLPEGWKETQAPDGRMYYFHTATKKTQWTRPVAEPADAAAPPPLPAGWKEAKAPDGRTYYFQAGSKTTQWTRPVADPEPSSEGGAEGGADGAGGGAEESAESGAKGGAEGDDDDHAAKRSRQE